MGAFREKLTVTRYVDASAFELLQPYWNNLLERTPADDPFLTWEWQSSWWQHYGTNFQMWLLVAWENDEPVGIAPLMCMQKVKRGIKARMLCIIGQWDIDHGGLIVPGDRPDVLEAFGRFLVEYDQEWDIMRLCNCRECGQDLKPFFQVFLPKMYINEIYQQCPHYYIPMDGDWNAYYNHLPKNWRRNLERVYRCLQLKYNFSFKCLTGTEITSKHLEDFFYIGLRGRYPDLYRNKNDRDFHRTLLRVMGSKGWMGLSLLYIENMPVAYNYGFIYRDRFYAWRTAYTPLFSELSPGNMLWKYTFEDCFNKIKEVDFLRGDADYKRRWTNLHREYVDWQIVRRWRLSTLMFVRFPNWKEQLVNIFRHSESS